MRHRFYLKKSDGTGYLGFAACWENMNKDMKKPSENWGTCQEAQGESTSQAQKFRGPETYQLLRASEEADGRETTGMGRGNHSEDKNTTKIFQNRLREHLCPCQPLFALSSAWGKKKEN